ncbi:MAG: ABC transporter ATP-binding protein [Desulfomonile tiedjei]|nr:ABC transporter ATP-binding protein [Desulfomonile tiedjei]
MTGILEAVSTTRAATSDSAVPVIEVRGLSKNFGGLRALSSVSFKVRAGEIAAVIGPNGAGKTTLFAVLSGFLPPSGGEICFEGNSVTGLRPRRLCHAGIARTFQVVRPFHEMTVFENVKAASVFGDSTKRSNSVIQREVNDILKNTGLAALADLYPPSLSLPHRKRLEVARAMATRPKLLLLDEVLAGLNPMEVKESMPLIKSLNVDHRITILMIEHNLRAIMGVCSRILVLNFGRLIFDGPSEDAVRDDGVIQAYLGRPKDA